MLIPALLIAWFSLAAAPSPDLNHDGKVGSADLALLYGAWGTDDPTYDLDGKPPVDSGDLAILLGAWGSPVGDPPVPGSPADGNPVPPSQGSPILPAVHPVMCYGAGGSLEFFDPAEVAGWTVTPFSVDSWRVTTIHWRHGGSAVVYIDADTMLSVMRASGWDAPRVIGDPPPALLEAIKGTRP